MTKTVTFIILIIALCANINAQENCVEHDYRTVDSSNQWNITTSVGLGSYNTSKQRFKKDSILIENKYYFQLETEETEFGENWIDYPLYMRECGGLLYGRISEDEEEVLYFDFNMEVGDTLYYTDYVGGDNLVISEINNIQYLDGSIRKTMTVKVLGGFGFVDIIEGIGSTIFPLTEFMYFGTFDYWRSLGCFTTNDNIVYIANFASNCWPVNVDYEINNMDVSIFPNPTKAILNIHSEIEWTELKIYDIQGKLNFTSDYSATIDINALHKGLHWVVLRNKNGTLFRVKVLKL